MRIYVLTEEEPFYLPASVDLVLRRRRNNVVEVATTPAAYRDDSLLQFAQRQLRFMGPVAFAVYGMGYLRSKVLDFLDRAGFARPPRPHSVAMACRRNGVWCQKITNVYDPSFLERVRSLRIDLIISISCPQLFGEELMGLARLGCLNVHSALLPKYRGWLPTFWVLANGETETGVTVQYMGRRIDEGDIILQRAVPIREDDTLDSLIRRCKAAGAGLLLDALDLIEQGRVQPQPIDVKDGSYYSFPTREAVTRFRALGRRFR